MCASLPVCVCVSLPLSDSLPVYICECVPRCVSVMCELMVRMQSSINRTESEGDGEASNIKACFVKACCWSLSLLSSCFEVKVSMFYIKFILCVCTDW